MQTMMYLLLGQIYCVLDEKLYLMVAVCQLQLAVKLLTFKNMHAL